MTALANREQTAATGRSTDGPATVRAARGSLRRRTVGVCVVLGLVALALFWASLLVGDFPLSARDVFFSLTGRGTRATDFVIYDLRLPRVITGLLVGVAFGISGAVFQALIRNPLASPGVIGITSGASASAVLAILVLGLSGAVVSVFACTGALITAVVIYLLSWRHGIAGSRLVLVGIGVAAVLQAVINYQMTRVGVADAQVALLWLTGSLNGASSSGVRPLALLLLVLVPITLGLARWLRGLQLGDDTATAIGLRVERSRLLLMGCWMALAAVATAAAGPVGFVAFVSGPVARRLTRASGAALVPAALVGACVVCLADFAGQHLLPVQLPVGVLTAAVEAPHLLYLLVVSNRVGHAG